MLARLIVGLVALLVLAWLGVMERDTRLQHRGIEAAGRLRVAGNEARGVADDVPIDEWVRIEHRGRAESLNVAMAVTVLCFEASTSRGAP